MHLSAVVIETTRRCNMCCDHCLRGNSQNKDMQQEYITALLDGAESISQITFSGGEPSLVVDIINFTLELAREKKVEVNSFYIATNGLEIKEDFVMACLRWYTYCWEKESCQVEISNDVHHSYCGDYDTELLEGLSFIRRKHTQENFEMSAKNGAINQGNYAENYNDGRELVCDPVEDQEEFSDATLYLNVDGNIINGCDWSYENQNDHILCQVSKLSNFFESLPEPIGF